MGCVCLWWRTDNIGRVSYTHVHMSTHRRNEHENVHCEQMRSIKISKGCVCGLAGATKGKFNRTVRTWSYRACGLVYLRVTRLSYACVNFVLRHIHVANQLSITARRFYTVTT